MKPFRHAPPGIVPLVPDVPGVARALAQAEPLVSLLQRLEASQRCLQAIADVVPPAMRPHLKAGPLDEEGWTLLVPNNAVSSKLRQLQPRLLDTLARKGCKVNAIRLRIQTP